MSEAMLSIQHLTKRFGGLTAVDDISIEVPERSIYAVVGPNGAGKTTLLQLAAAQLHPTRGTVKILDDQLGKADVFDLRPRIGFASTALGRRMPADERVMDVVLTAAWSVTGRWNETYDEIDVRRAQRVLGEWHLDSFEDRLFGSLSDGEQKRVQIARAVMTDPELLLLDEPAASLDLGAREELLQLLSGFASAPDAPAMVMVTHHVEEIPRGFTHALLLADGAVRAAGPLDEVITAANLSDTFGLDLVVTNEAGRFTARAAG